MPSIPAMQGALARAPAAQGALRLQQQRRPPPLPRRSRPNATTRRTPAASDAAMPAPQQAAQGAWRGEQLNKQQQQLDGSPTSSSLDSSGSSDAGWQDARRAIQAQQAAGLAEPYPLDKTRQIVETAMLAAVTALAYTVGNLLRVEAYLAYILPLPVVLAALRSGPAAALKTLTVAVLLLLILMGPVRAVTYLLVYGVLSLVLGAAWAWRLPWLLSVPLGAAARIGGYLAYISLSSWVSNENLLMLMLTNVYALLDQFSAFLGTTGSPPLLAVVVVLCSLLFVNSIMYLCLMHLLYAIMLRGMGITIRMPRIVAERVVGQLPEM